VLPLLPLSCLLSPAHSGTMNGELFDCTYFGFLDVFCLVVNYTEWKDTDTALL